MGSNRDTVSTSDRTEITAVTEELCVVSLAAESPDDSNNDSDSDSEDASDDSSIESSEPSDSDDDEPGALPADGCLASVDPEQLWPVCVREVVPKAKQQKGAGGPRPTKSHKKLPKEIQRTNKELRKERIAAKRAERAKIKGFDVRAVDRQLCDMVTSGLDVHAFQPMGDWGLKATQQMAACYGLRGSVCGSVKKRFVMVRSTERARLPEGELLEALIAIRARSEVTHAEVCESQEPEIRAKKHRKAKKQAPKRKDVAVIDENPSGMYAVPMAFVSGGVQESLELVREAAGNVAPAATAGDWDGDGGLGVPNSGTSSTSESEGEPVRMGLGASATALGTGPYSHPREFGAFERHTSGFGSKMLTKMGFVAGSGLGASGQGIATPLESVQRAPRLGLGAELGSKPSK